MQKIPVSMDGAPFDASYTVALMSRQGDCELSCEVEILRLRAALGFAEGRATLRMTRVKEVQDERVKEAQD